MSGVKYIFRLFGLVVFGSLLGLALGAWIGDATGSNYAIAETGAGIGALLGFIAGLLYDDFDIRRRKRREKKHRKTASDKSKSRLE